MPRRTPPARDTRDNILESAMQVFGERGYSGSSVDDIAARAGVTKGAVYYYFTDKDDLARELQHTLWTRLADKAIHAFEPGAGAMQNLERGFDAYLDALRTMPEARLFLLESWAVPSLEDSARGERESAFAPLETLLRDGIARGEIVDLDPEAMARALVGLYAEATAHVLRTGEDGPTRAVVRRFVGALAVAPVEPVT